MTCKDCKFWKATEDSSFGRCLRFPPTWKITGESYEGKLVSVSSETEFPYTGESEWCGEFKVYSSLQKPYQARHSHRSP